ncbi:hypothetical protein Tco_1285543 [Tanacetum coccineum]
MLIKGVPLMDMLGYGEEFEASRPSGTRTISSYSSASSNSTVPLSPDYPLTHASPTPTPAMSPGHSARVAEAMALSDSAFRKRYRSYYDTPSPSLTLLVRKRYRGTSELILDTDSEGTSWEMSILRRMGEYA